MEAIAIPKGFRVTPEQFEQLAYAEKIAKLELTETGKLIVMSATSGTAGRKNSRLIQQLRNWADLDGKGEVFDSSTVFVLPNGARRGSNVSWIKVVTAPTRDVLSLFSCHCSKAINSAIS